MKFLLIEVDKTDINELTSYLASISTLNLTNFLKNDFENTSVLLYNYMRKTDHYLDILQYIISSLETQHFFILNEHKIFVFNKSLFKLILLMSLKHYEEIFSRKCKSVTTENIEGVIQLILGSYLTNSLFIHVLRILDSILKKYKNIIRHELCIDIFIFAQKISLCPIEGFKYYSQIISKHVIPYFNIECVNLVSFLPLRGLETSELIPLFSKTSSNEEFTKDIVFKVLHMFSNNLESREGGFLYKTLMFTHFYDWKRLVWPYFYPKIISVDYEGEFIQSILKYWIPITFNTYKLEFYNHMYDTPIPMYIKGQILLAIRKKQCFNSKNYKMMVNLNSLIMNKTYRSLGLQILSIFYKRTTYPTENELHLLKLFLFSQVNELDNDEFKYVWRFLSHLTIILSDQNVNSINNTNVDLVHSYTKLLNDIFNFGFNLLKLGQPKLGAQLLKIFWKLYEGEINVCYKLERGIHLAKCTILKCKDSYEKLSKVIEDILIKSKFYYIEVTNLACYLSNYMKFYYDYLIEFVNNNKHYISIKTSESVRNLAKIVTSKNNTHENEQLYFKIHNEVKRKLTKTIRDDSVELENIFEEVLLFDILLEIIKYKIKIDESYCEEIVGLCIAVVQHIFRLSAPGKVQRSEEESKIEHKETEHILNSKTKKIMEAFLNNILQFIMETLNCADLKSVMTFLISIIELSNMRRPTTTCAQILILASEKKYDDDIRNSDLENFKILLLCEVLCKLLQVPLVQHLTIRRNPESRLIVHALCVSDNTAKKATLKWVFWELLNILSSENTDSTLSSALNCIETLISDNTLYNDTFEFIPEVFLICIKLFDLKSWTVRNANIQLAKALIDRFHGILVGYNNRPKSIDDLFNIFPSLAVPFYQTLSSDPLTDSSIIVMQFFSESQLRKKLFDDDYLAMIRDTFLILFVRIIKSNSNHYGIFAVRSYVSLCLEDVIPIIIYDIVNYITENMIVIKQNHTLSNFILLLNELYNKYKIYIKTLPKLPNTTCLIKKSFEALKKHFSYFNSKQFDLLLVKVQSVSEVLNVFSNNTLKLYNWEDRLWQHNYLPYICVNCKENEVAAILENVLSHSILDCIQIKILEVLVDRYCAKHFSKSSVKSITQLLIKKMFEVEDTKSYLLCCYFKVIFCFIKHYIHEKDQWSLTYIKKLCGTFNCLYKLFVVILLLDRSALDDNDKLIFKQTVMVLKVLKINDIETAKVLSQMLPFLFKIAFCVCDKYFLFKLAIFLIIRYDLWDFVEFVSNCEFPTATFAMVKILDYKTLLDHLNDSSVTLHFVTEVFQYVNQKDTDKLENCTNLTYYVEEESCYIDNSTINKIVLKFLIDYNKAVSNNEWFEYYKIVNEDNKK